VAGKPILVAERLVGDDNDAAMVIAVANAGSTTAGAVGTSGRSATTTDPNVVANADAATIDQHTRLNSVRVAPTLARQGFFIAV
jgi:hypothetical protein